MGSICLSSASILRCDSLGRNQNLYLIIPTALEVVFSISLIFIDRGLGKRNLLITAEGLSFLTLVVLELVAQTIPAVRGNLRLFKAFDLAIGIASFLPISLYTIFLYLFANAEIGGVLPRRIKSIAKMALILFIPAIITFNEIASFIGISIRNIPGREAPETVIAIGFSGSTQQGLLWKIFTSLTLVLLAGFQIIICCLAFFRLTQAILDQKRIKNQCSDKAHLIKGIGWITGSLKLGVIETGIGFAGGGFGVVLTRRILRLLVRASLCIGVAKGVDIVEDFRAIKNEPWVAGRGKFRRSQMRQFISYPRLSTFRRLSPKATTFHVAQKNSDVHEQSGSPGLPDMVHFANVKARKDRQRVTVKYNRGIPSLHVRFSVLDIPSLAFMAEEIKSRPQSEWDAHLSRPQPIFHRPFKPVFRDSAESVPSFSGPFELVTAPQRTLSQRSARAQLYQAASPAASGESLNPYPTTAVESQNVGRAQSTKSLQDSLQAVHDLASQFPGPPMAFKDQKAFINSSVWEEVPIEAMPMPQALGSPSDLLSDNSACRSTTSYNNRTIRSSRQPILYTVTGTPIKSAPLYFEKSINPFNDDGEEDVRRPVAADKKTSGATLHDPEARTGDTLNPATALDSGESRQFLHKSDKTVGQIAEWIGSRSRATRRFPDAEIPAKLSQHSHGRGMSIDRVVNAVSKRDMPLTKVKSVGSAPKKFTPLLPIQPSLKRGSMHPKPIIILAPSGNTPEIEDEYE